MNACMVENTSEIFTPSFSHFSRSTVTVKLGVCAVNEQKAVEVAGILFRCSHKFLNAFFKCVDVIRRVTLLDLHCSKTCRDPDTPYRWRLNGYYGSIFYTCFCHPFSDIVHNALHLFIRCSSFIPGR